MRSTTPPLLSAAAMPAAPPIRTAITSASPAIDRSTGRAVRMLSDTGTVVNHERPRSPCSAFPSQVTYCCQRGTSRPNSCFIRAMSAGVAVSPSTAAAGFAPDKAPSAKVRIVDSTNTVAVMTSSRPNGRTDCSSRPPPDDLTGAAAETEMAALTRP